jgi:hypothetical protein
LTEILACPPAVNHRHPHDRRTGGFGSLRRRGNASVAAFRCAARSRFPADVHAIVVRPTATVARRHVAMRRPGIAG